MARDDKSFAARAAWYSSMALTLPVGTGLGYLLGWWLDSRFGTTWLKILFLILGSIAGFVTLIRQIMQDTRDDDSG